MNEMGCGVCEALHLSLTKPLSLGLGIVRSIRLLALQMVYVGTQMAGSQGCWTV